MIKVAAITQGRIVPSARYRVRQNVPFLKKYHVHVTEYFPRIDLSSSINTWPRTLRKIITLTISPAIISSRIIHIHKSGNFDLVWLQREMIPGYLIFERFIKPPLVFDVDDAIWLTNKGICKGTSPLFRNASCIIAGNNFIADWFSRFNKNVVVIPTGVDTKRFKPQEKKKHDIFTIGWIGTSSNLKYLENIEGALRSFLMKHKDSRLLVISNDRPNFSCIPSKQVQFLRWTESLEVPAIQMMDVGIMPLIDDEWTKGKCSFKMLQYMACGVPVISSPVGMNKEVLAQGEVGFAANSSVEWVEALNFLYNNREAAKKMGANGRNVVIEKYSSKVVSKKLAKIFYSLI